MSKCVRGGKGREESYPAGGDERADAGLCGGGEDRFWGGHASGNGWYGWGMQAHLSSLRRRQRPPSRSCAEISVVGTTYVEIYVSWIWGSPNVDRGWSGGEERGEVVRGRVVRREVEEVEPDHVCNRRRAIVSLTSLCPEDRGMGRVRTHRYGSSSRRASARGRGSCSMSTGCARGPRGPGPSAARAARARASCCGTC